MQETIDLIAQYGYVILFLYSLGGGFIALVGAGVLSFTGKMDLTLSILIAAVANYIGDLMLFYLTRYQKQMLQPYLKNHRRKLALVHVLMHKYGSVIIIIKKYLYGIKTLVPIAIALTPYSALRFHIYNALGAVLWSVSIGILAYFLGELLLKVFAVFSDYPYIAPLCALIAIGGLWFWLSRKAKR